MRRWVFYVDNIRILQFGFGNLPVSNPAWPSADGPVVRDPESARGISGILARSIDEEGWQASWTYPLRPNICTLGDAIRARWICQHLYTNLTILCVPWYHLGTNGVFLLHQTFHHLGFPEFSLGHWLQEQHASLPTMRENATSVHHTYRSLLTPTSEIT